MLKAFHKTTGEFISSYAIQRNIKWKGKEKDIYIAPRPEIFNWKELNKKGIKEVEVSFIKQHKRNINNEEIQIIPHFRIKNEHAIPNPLNESEEHKLSKEGIYEAIYFKELIIDGKNIGEFNIKNIDIEQKLSSSKESKIADVCCEFEKEDSLYGKGIVFEIQFSYQNEERTEERTYDRVLERYSVCWMWKGDFDEDNKLKNKSLKIIPYSDAIKEYSEKVRNEFQKDLILFMQHYDEQKKKLDEDTQAIKQLQELMSNEINKNHVKTITELQEYKKEIVESLSKEKERIFSEELKLDSIIEDIKNKVNNKINKKELTENIIKVILDKIQDSLNSKIDYSIIKYLNNNLTKNYYQQIMQKEIGEKLIPKIEEQFNLIKGVMMFKCQNCNNLKRLSTYRINERKGVVCVSCDQELKKHEKENWYKKEVGDETN